MDQFDIQKYVLIKRDVTDLRKREIPTDYS